MRDWEYQQQQDEQQRVEEAERILRAAEYRALSSDERTFLAVEAGLGDYFKKEAK